MEKKKLDITGQDGEEDASGRCCGRLSRQCSQGREKERDTEWTREGRLFRGWQVEGKHAR